jgi:hypothetical protein
VCLWKRAKKAVWWGRIGMVFAKFFFGEGGGECILFSGCDQIQELLGMGGDGNDKNPQQPTQTTHQ